MKRAFTIIELLIVMAVIGILITLAVVGISALQRSQRETMRLNDMRNIKVSLTDFYTKYRNYPPSYDYLVISPDWYLCIKDWSVANGGNAGIDSTCNATTTGDMYYNKIKINQQGAAINANNFAGVPISTTVTAPSADCVTGKGPDTWSIYYKTNFVGTGAQQYGLYACTENGLSINFGEIDD